MVRAEAVMVSKKGYARAPIVEAVFEARFSETLSEREMERSRDHFKSKYPNVEDRSNIKIEVKPNNIVSSNATIAGYQMTAKNAVDVVLIQSASIGSIRRAPYTTWDELIDVARNNYDAFIKIVGRKTVTRIGARFINRFDIPTEEIEGGDVVDWICTSVVLPDKLAKTIGPYSLAVNFVHLDTGVNVLVQSGIVAPALLKHVSINLDIDAYIDSDIPVHREKLWDIAPRLREAKNSVFESLITGKLRERFR
jgi:uncharacterized protein (TIGR04255 family)